MILSSDVFDICKRIKIIDKDYLVNWNSAKQRYEIVRKANGLMTIEVVVPYKTLDKRTVDLVIKSSVRHLNKRLSEIDRANRLLDEKRLEDTKYQLSYDLKLLLS